ncbi:hypothetical protein, unlikely [Trypanosoma congolense IL3000]|uniref:Uncharacterized protein n=1 Tax=Trypanosoma congolense (strain IL3000) TaxID=1068625 RepID=F9W826_TRYCI|nr:hypothetical protein, unlikely [Trypanosoma congolense IL3000]
MSGKGKVRQEERGESGKCLPWNCRFYLSGFLFSFHAPPLVTLGDDNNEWGTFQLTRSYGKVINYVEKSPVFSPPFLFYLFLLYFFFFVVVVCVRRPRVFKELMVVVVVGVAAYRCLPFYCTFLLAPLPPPAL